ncbi:MAG: CHAD domain-containing protein [Chloroflexi bacterium]|nr:MAG: CHAD domain-containing protein [Chloroflexota bacterium]
MLTTLTRESEHVLTGRERTLLKRLAHDADRKLAARAQLVLAWAAGLSREDSARASGLRPEQVQHWTRAFARKRMEMFPASALERAARGRAGATTMSAMLRQRRVALAHPRYVAELAQTLFNETQAVHQLPAECCKLLATAAMLHTIALRAGDDDYQRTGRAVVLAHDIRGFSAQERDMLACLVAFHRKKVKPAKDLIFAALDAESQQLTLRLAALLRVADGLDASETQTTHITAIHANEWLDVQVEGPHAVADARRATKNADLWQQLYSPPLIARLPGEPLPTRAARTPDLDDEPTAQEPLTLAGRRIVKTQLDKLRECEEPVRSGTDAEAIHDMRVASRRLRSLFRLLGDYYSPKELQGVIKPLRELAGDLGAVRDLDVLIENARKYSQTLPAERQPALEVLLGDWYAQRVTAHRRALRFLDSRAYRQWATRMTTFTKRSEPAGAPRVLDELPALVWQHYAALRRYEDRVKAAPLNLLHQVRIDSKRLRYALEFFEEVLDAAVPELLETLVALQDHLGELHDADVARQMVVEFITQQTSRIETLADTSALQEATAYLGALQARIAERHTSVPELWQPLVAPDFRQKLGEAVAAL